MYQKQTEHSHCDATDAPARILVVGVGALGCPAAQQLAAFGTSSGETGSPGLLTLIDPDLVELSNLQRQPLFDDGDIGAPKAEVAAARLGSTESCRVQWLCKALDADNAEALIAAHDYVIDATDSPSTKFLINDTACRLGVPFSYGGVVRTGGQAMAVVPGQSACLRCAFPEAAEADEGGACSELGILAPVAGVIGSLQAAQALGHTNGRPFEAGVMTIYNVRGERFRRVTFGRRGDCPGCSCRTEPRSATTSPNSHTSSSPPSGSIALADTVDVTSATVRRQTTCHS